MKKLITILLILATMLAAFGSVSYTTASAASSHVYMIVTNPGEDSNTQMCIGFHSDWEYTSCYIQYTTASDTGFTNAKRVNPTKNTEAYTWFYGHATTNAGANPFTKKFIDWDAVLTGLKPNTNYIYRVCDGTDYSKTYKFKTAGAENFSIIWTSDAHVNSASPARLTDQREIFSFLETKAKYSIGFHFNTGDIVAIGDRYNDWLSVANSEFMQNYMFAPVVGNHDVYDAAMTSDPAYTQYFKSSEYFKYVYANPKNAYVHQSQRLQAYLANDGIADPDGSKAREDTNGKNYWFNYNGCLFIVFDYWTFHYGAKEVTEAFTWASNVIKANEGKYNYLICSDHLNLIAGHGGGSRYYEEKYMSFLDENNVDIFLAGDNHIWLRTDRLYNKQVITDPAKGTYIIQAPCISRPQTVTCTEPAGYAVAQYSIANATLGSTVIDVTPEGMTFTMYAKESGAYKQIDTVTIPKKVRANTPVITPEDPIAVTSPDYGTIKDDMLVGAKLGMKCAELCMGFNLDVTVKTPEGYCSNGDVNIATGWTVGTDKQRLTIVVTGDVSGNGKVRVTDYLMTKRIVQGTYDPNEPNKLAADVDGDGSYTATDYQNIKLYFKGQKTF